MGRSVILMMVQLVEVRDVVLCAVRCERPSAVNLQSKALQRQANQQQDAQELAHGVVGRKVWSRLYQHEILMVVPVVNVREMRMAVAQRRMDMRVHMGF